MFAEQNIPSYITQLQFKVHLYRQYRKQILILKIVKNVIYNEIPERSLYRALKNVSKPGLIVLEMKVIISYIILLIVIYILTREV